MWAELREGLGAALATAGLDAPGRLDRLELAIPRDASHGDWTTNLALLLAKDVGRPPRAVAEALAAAYPRAGGSFAAVEVAGPGFLNFRYSDEFLAALPGRLLGEGERFGASDAGRGERVLVEYVSANPTGPLNVVSARAAAVGASLVRLLRATGHEAAGEFYVNDAGNQVELLGESLAARFAERIGVARPFPENGYVGGYLRDVAAELPEGDARRMLEAADGAAWFRDQALERMLATQKRDLADYGAEYDRWFRESELHAGAPPEGRSRVAATLAALDRAGALFESEGARWLRATAYGDDKDRVVVRGNGVPTYLLPDLAYHADKRARGWRRAINLWGPDHHAYVTTLQSGLRALGLEPDFLQVLIVQQVNLLRDGEEVKMSKRAGEFVTLRDLLDEVGPDCAKFFFLMRTSSSHLDFDLTLAKQQNDENPAYYVQYAHARIASVLRKAAERGLAPETGAPATLEAAEERALVRKLAAFPEVVRGAAVAREPHRIPTYLIETAAEFHRFYHACRIVTDDAARSRARLRLAAAARQVLRNGLALLGVSAPERLERAAEATA